MTTDPEGILTEMKSRIDKIEALAAEIGELGRGVAAVEKNLALILQATFVMKFGISDPAEASKG